MPKTTINIPFEATVPVMDALGVDYAQALCMVNLYGYMTFRSKGGVSYCSKGEIVRNSRMSRSTVHRHVEAMEKAGWIEPLESGANNTIRYALKGLPREAQRGLTMSPAHDEPTRDEPTRDEQGGLLTMSPPGGITMSHKPTHDESPLKTLKNKQPKEQQKREQPSTSSKKNQNNKAERVKALWNEHKPNSWQGIQVMGNRMKTVDRIAQQCGGFEAFCELLPQVLAVASSDKWWGTKKISWVNFMGQGSTSKAHFEEFADRAATAGQRSKQDNPGRLEHPEFFPPNPSGLMIARSGVRFSSIEDKQAREAVAREFYANRNR